MLGREDPLINLGLALFGRRSDTGLSLFKKGDKNLRKAVMAGTTVYERFSFGLHDWITDKNIIDDLLLDENEDLLGALLSNPLVPDEYLTRLYKREAPFNNLSESKWMTQIAYTTNNSRLSRDYNDSWLDGFAEYKHGLVCESAWKVFREADVNDRSAAVLARLGEMLLKHPPDDMNIKAVIERWRPATENEDARGSYRYCRQALSELRNVSKVFASDDLALRQAFYAKFKPKNASMIREYFNMDRDDFLETAVSNENLYRTGEYREVLSDCCTKGDSNGDLLYFNVFNSVYVNKVNITI